jgi:hypothetical protein
MNRNRTNAIATAAVLTVGVGAGAAIAAIAPASAGRSETPAPFSVRISSGSDKTLDLGRPGFSVGDQDLFTGTIVRDGTHVGHMVGRCTTARVGATTADQVCEWTLSFGDGQISAFGVVVSGQQGPGTFVLPIVGGTRRYAMAAGQLKITASDGAIPVRVGLR